MAAEPDCPPSHGAGFSDPTWPDFVPARWRLSSNGVIDLLRRNPGGRPQQFPDAATLPRCRSVYVPMPDGVRLAVDVWTPTPDTPLPAVVNVTRYWRASERPVRHGPDDKNAFAAACWARNGFAYVVVDPRGSGASFGTRAGEQTAAEIDDYARIVEWVARQKWCTGWVAGEGGSYSANAAVMMTIGKPRGLRALVSRFGDFSSYEGVSLPGGIHNLFVLNVWGTLTRILDSGDISPLIAGAADGGPPAAVRPKAVDGDEDQRLLQAALRDHADNSNILNQALRVEFADETSGAPDLSREGRSVCGHLDAIAANPVPQYVWASWFDAGTADGALSYYASLPHVPMRVMIGAWSHMGGYSADPYEAGAPQSGADSIDDMADFFRQTQAEDGGFPAREIRYYTLGQSLWKSSEVWPPRGHEFQIWHLQPGNLLARDPVAAQSGDSDVYAVDLTASTGTRNRWHTQVGGGPVAYDDRDSQAAKRLIYVSPVLADDMEITGHPAVEIFLVPDKTDAALFVYLEHVLADGRVIPLSEGELRGIHHRESAAGPPWAVFGPRRTFHRADAVPLKPGEVNRLAFRLLPISVVLRRGSRFRLSIAGADVDTFAVYPGEVAQEWRVLRTDRWASNLRLPVMPAPGRADSRSGK